MSSISSLSASGLSSIQAGFSTLDRAAADFNSAALANPPTPDATSVAAAGATDADTDDTTNTVDSTDLTHASAANFDPTVAGVFDLSIAKFQVDAGAVLLNYDQRDRQTIFDLLKP